MKVTNRYVPAKKTGPPGATKETSRNVGVRKSIRYFRKVEFIYAALFLGFIIVAVMRFDNKQDEAQSITYLGTVQSVTDYDRAFGTVVVKTNLTRFITTRRAGLTTGDHINVQKLFSGKYQICSTGKENCTEIEKNAALAIRPPS